MTHESHITLTTTQTAFRLFVYREGEGEPIGTIEGSLSPQTYRLDDLSFTDAISAKTTRMAL